MCGSSAWDSSLASESAIATRRVSRLTRASSTSKDSVVMRDLDSALTQRHIASISSCSTWLIRISESAMCHGFDSPIHRSWHLTLHRSMCLCLLDGGFNELL